MKQIFKTTNFLSSCAGGKYWERKALDRRRKPANAVIKEYVVPKIKEVSKIITFSKKTKLLDIGAGNGFFTFYFDKICDVCGIDSSEKMLEMNPVKKTCQMDARRLKFKDNSFDVVFCHAVLHHIQEMDSVIQEMKRVSGKYVVIMEPNRNNLLMFIFSAIVKEERQALKFSLSFLKRLIKKNGLNIIDAFSYGQIVPNKTPAFLLPLCRLFNFRHAIGMTNIIIAEV